MTQFYYCKEHSQILVSRSGMHWKKKHKDYDAIDLGSARMEQNGRRNPFQLDTVKKKLSEVLGRPLTPDEIKEIESK